MCLNEYLDSSCAVLDTVCVILFYFMAVRENQFLMHKFK